MDTVVRKIIMVTAFCVSVNQCEPIPLNNQYGAPENLAGLAAQGNQYQQQHPITNSYGVPLNDGHRQDEHQNYIDSQPKSYEFGYAVKDIASGNDFGRRETSDGDTVRGEYRVQLPDGRTQIVTYTADWQTGFHADVRYEGTAQFPDQYNTGNQGYNSNINNNINNNLPNSGYDHVGNNSPFNNGAGTQGGYNNYQDSSNNYNSVPGYNYQYSSSSIDSGYSGGNTYVPVPPPPPTQPTYGVPFH